MSRALRGHLLTFALVSLGFFASFVLHGADPMVVFPVTLILGVLAMGVRYVFLLLWTIIKPRPDPGSLPAPPAVATPGTTLEGSASGAPHRGAAPAPPAPARTAPRPRRWRRVLIWLGIYGVIFAGILVAWLDRNAGPIDFGEPFVLLGLAIVSSPIPAFIALIFTGGAYFIYRIFASQFERLDDLTEHGAQLFEPFRAALSQRAAVSLVKGQLGTLRFFGQMHGVDFSCELLTVNAHDTAVYTGRRLTVPFALSLVRLQVAMPAGPVGSAVVENALRQRVDRSLSVTRNATGFDISAQLRLVEPDGSPGIAPLAFAEWMTSALRTVWETASGAEPGARRDRAPAPPVHP